MQKNFIKIGLCLIVAVLTIHIILTERELIFQRDLVTKKHKLVKECIEQTKISIQNTEDCQKYLELREKRTFHKQKI